MQVGHTLYASISSSKKKVIQYTIKDYILMLLLKEEKFLGKRTVRTDKIRPFSMNV